MGFFLMPGGGIGKNFIILCVDVRYSILILGECPTQGLDGMTLITEKKNPINFTEHNKNFYLNLHYNVPNSYLFVNGVEIIKFKAKASEINTTLLCLGNVPKRNVRW